MFALWIACHIKHLLEKCGFKGIYGMVLYLQTGLLILKSSVIWKNMQLKKIKLSQN